MYTEMRDLNFRAVGQFLSKEAKKITAAYEVREPVKNTNLRLGPHGRRKRERERERERESTVHVDGHSLHAVNVHVYVNTYIQCTFAVSQSCSDKLGVV